MLKVIALFVLGLVLLIVGGNWFVDGAIGVAKKFKMPEVLIGATVVSLGTTLPEVLVSSQAAMLGHGEIAYGNAIGSIICNVSLIAAIPIAFRPSRIDPKQYQLPVIFFFIAAAVYAFNAYVFKGFSRLSGIVLLLIFAVYMFFSVRQAKEKQEIFDENDISDVVDLPSDEPVVPFWISIVKLVLGAAMIAFGANLLVDNGTLLAQALGVPEAVIALTFVALGTSLPELVTAIVSLVKGHGDLTAGNVIGANLLNLVLVSGISTVISPYTIPMEKTLFGINSSLILDIPLMLFVMLFMILPAFRKKSFMRWQGIILLAVYAGYCVLQFTI
ncbi:MAG: calcium/sodium antiporter [Lachnospiraceae bacterium]|nr:calcium/sodium antiporter [Lachnospiraceae bacterium]